MKHFNKQQKQELEERIMEENKKRNLAQRTEKEIGGLRKYVNFISMVGGLNPELRRSVPLPGIMKNERISSAKSKKEVGVGVNEILKDQGCYDVGYKIEEQDPLNELHNLYGAKLEKGYKRPFKSFSQVNLYKNASVSLPPVN